VEPTIVTGVTLDSPLMAEELFGPILPVLTFKTLDEAISMLHALENSPHTSAGTTQQQRTSKPLALYVFAKSRHNIDKITSNVQSGGCTFNDVVMHTANPFLPFGGVGSSGMGAYHGKNSFLCFSHSRAVLRRDDHTITDVTARYPPFSPLKLQIFRIGFLIPPLPLLRSWAIPLLVVGTTWAVTRWWYTGLVGLPLPLSLPLPLPLSLHQLPTTKTTM
jgi:aldehyde dehydrogenase (NAD+)